MGEERDGEVLTGVVLGLGAEWICPSSASGPPAVLLAIPERDGVTGQACRRGAEELAFHDDAVVSGAAVGRCARERMDMVKGSVNSDLKLKSGEELSPSTASILASVIRGRAL